MSIKKRYNKTSFKIALNFVRQDFETYEHFYKQCVKKKIFLKNVTNYSRNRL